MAELGANRRSTCKNTSQATAALMPPVQSLRNNSIIEIVLAPIRRPRKRKLPNFLSCWETFSCGIANSLTEISNSRVKLAIKYFINRLSFKSRGFHRHQCIDHERQYVPSRETIERLPPQLLAQGDPHGHQVRLGGMNPSYRRQDF